MLHRFLVLTLLLVASASIWAAPITLEPNSQWVIFQWTNGIGPISNPADGFTVTLSAPTLLDLTDCYVAGDMFSVTVDGGAAVDSLFAAPDPAAPWTGDPDTAWADPQWSHLSILLGPGTHSIAISLTQLALYPDSTPMESGTAYIRAESPEPVTFVLVGFGLIGLAAVSRKRS
jgi:hypothetical protein